MGMTHMEACNKLDYAEAVILTYLGVAQTDKKDLRASFESWEQIVTYIKTLGLTRTMVTKSGQKGMSNAIFVQINAEYDSFETNMNTIYAIINKSKDLGEDHTKILAQWTAAKNRVKAIKNLIESIY